METLDLSLQTQIVFLFRIVVAGALGAIIGYERQREFKPAQLRDYILVCVGACLFAVVGLALGGTTDASRVVSTVVTGVGFLGAGVILRQGRTVRGITTAASIWAVAAIGVSVGIGLYLLAAATTLGVFLVLWFMEEVAPPEGGSDSEPGR